jgi:hypothetical protein
LLRPLSRRRTSPANLTKIENAFRELEERAVASSLLPELVAQSRLARASRSKDDWKDAGTAKSRIKLAFTLYLARRISFQEYVFMVSQAAESVHEGRILGRIYPELERLSSAMRQVEKKHGLNADEFWPAGDEPPEYARLSMKWEKTADKLLVETLEELGARDVSDLYKRDRAEFDRLRERGRRSFFHKDELVPALTDTVRRYEVEAQAAARASAFTAAVSMLGAAMEGLLLLRCLRAKTKAIHAARSLPPKLRPRDPNAFTRWTLENLIQVCLHAGWLPRIDTPTLSIRPDGLADLLRRMRNQIHPGRVCSERPWIEANRREFDDAEVIYATLYATVFRGTLLRRLAVSTGGGDAE